MNYSNFLAVLLFCLFTIPNNGITQVDKTSLYKNGWIDFNKNGKKDIFDNPFLTRIFGK